MEVGVKSSSAVALTKGFDFIMNKLCQLTIHEAHELLKRSEISSVDLTKATLERIAEVEEISLRLRSS